MRSHLWCSVAILPLVLAAGRLAVAEDDSGITVQGTGEVKAKPTRVEIELQTAGSAELTGDAIVKYRDAKRRTMEAFAKLKIKNLAIEEQGLALANAGGANTQGMVVFPGGQPAAATPQVEISRSLRVALTEIQSIPEEELMETIGKILDTAKDSGAIVATSATNNMIARMWGQQVSSSLVAFVVDNAAELRLQAYKRAMEQARDRATRLAGLASLKLGPIISVKEGPQIASSEATPQQLMMAMYGLRESGGTDDDRLKSERFDDVSVRVNLQVRFAIDAK